MKNFLQIIDVLLEKNGIESGTEAHKLFSQMYADRASEGEFDSFQKSVIFGKNGVFLDYEKGFDFSEYEAALDKCTDSFVLNTALNLREIVESDIADYCIIRETPPEYTAGEQFVVLGNEADELDVKKYRVFFADSVPNLCLLRCVITEQHFY